MISKESFKEKEKRTRETGLDLDRTKIVMQRLSLLGARMRLVFGNGVLTDGSPFRLQKLI